MSVLTGFFFIDVFGIWLGLSLLSILIMVLVETLHERFATVVFVGVLAYLRQTHCFDIVAFGTTNPWGLAFYAVLYVTFGAVCLYPAWLGFVVDYLEDQEEFAKKFKRQAEWKAPEAADHKEQLTSWVFLWPWKMFWFLLRHPVRRIKQAIFNAMEKHLNALSVRMTNRARDRWNAKAAGR